MKYNNLSSFLIFFLLLLVENSLKAQTSSNEVKWEILKSSTLTVDGKSNVNNFSCLAKEYTNKDTIKITKHVTNKISILGELEMEILDFNCHNNLMTNELRKAVKSKRYHTMKIHFISLESMPDVKNRSDTIKGGVEISLAGIIKKFELIYLFEAEGLNNMKLSGAHDFLFTDFNLLPPRKFGGLVRIKNGFEVNFSLNLKMI
ncbi:MAG: hypothetical protein NVS3B19_13980 [Ginsengibacter sp.]